MTIARDEGRMQIVCDHCPASYPNSYAAEDFAVMIADAKAAGWSIRRLPPDTGPDRDTSDLFGRAPRPGSPPAACRLRAGQRIAGDKKPEPYTHTCSSCAHEQKRASLL